MFFHYFFGLLSCFLSLNIYIDSNFLGDDSNGSITSPFTFFDELAIIPMITSNQIQETEIILMISNFCFIKNPIYLENVQSFVFKYFYMFFLNFSKYIPRFQKRSNTKNTQNYLKFIEKGSMYFANSTVSIIGLTIEIDSFINRTKFCFHIQKKSTFQINVISS